VEHLSKWGGNSSEGLLVACRLGMGLSSLPGRKLQPCPRLLYCYQDSKLAVSQWLNYPQVGVRVDEDVLKRLDEWRRKQGDLPGRPEAIRRLVELGLKVKK